jgi:Tol biopolymer transport system component
MKRLAFTLFLLTVTACVPVSSTNVSAKDTLVSTLSYHPTQTEVPSQTPSPIPTSTTVPTPGPDLAVLYINQGQIKRFNFHTWSEETLPLSSSIRFAELSPDGQKLAYGDETGLYLSKSPFEVAQKINDAAEISSTSNARSLLFSPDSTLLALSDSEGLKILHLLESRTELFAKNNLVEGGDYKRYIPVSWSPDSRYLWTDVGFYESESSIIADAVSKRLSDYPCYSNAVWLTESTLIGTSYYAGRWGCISEPGVFLISLNGKNQKATQIYGDKVNLPESQSFGDLSLSPSKEHIVFSEDLEGLGNDKSFSFLMDVNGKNVREIIKPDLVDNYYRDVFWSPSEENIFFNSDHEVYVYSVETGEWSPLYKNTDKKINIEAVSPDGKWLFLSNMTLLSTETGEAISLNENSLESQEQVFIGWLGTK